MEALLPLYFFTAWLCRFILPNTAIQPKKQVQFLESKLFIL